MQAIPLNSSDTFDAQLERLKALLSRHQLDVANQFCSGMLQRWPARISLLQLAARLQQMLGRFDQMLGYAQKACDLDPDSVLLQLQLAEFQAYCGEFRTLRSGLHKLEKKSELKAGHLAQIAQSYTNAGNHEDAERCFRLAVNRSPGVPGIRFGFAASLIATGKARQAEEELDEVIRQNPHDYAAYLNRSTARAQTSVSNHIEELEKLLSQPLQQPAGEAQLSYALGKEYEDLAQYDKAFEFYRRGASARRKLLRYKVEDDVAMLEEIRRLHNADFIGSTDWQNDKPGPIFVVGLPRSGTTLVDRILDSHWGVNSLGEINDFAYALIRAARAGTGKRQLLEASVRMDHAQLGNLYTRSTGERIATDACLLDKTPLNSLYLGLIHCALPSARIVYVRRNPMDICFAMFKTMFLMGYPFSYSFEDLAAYYVSHNNLMNHWQNCLGERMLVLDYESLVSRQESETRRLLNYCGLPFAASCLSFHQNPSATATASAAQVRQPLYSTSVERWKHFADRLEPLRQNLSRQGLL